MGALTLPLSGRVYIDTQSVIYSVEKHPIYWPILHPLWQAMKRGSVELFSSELTLLETLVGPYKSGDALLEATYEQLLSSTELRADTMGRSQDGTRYFMKVLVTGAAGFIGYHVSQKLLDRGDEVIGLDNVNPYYEVALKEARLNQLRARDGFTFYEMDLEDREGVSEVFKGEIPERVVNLAAQAGVRYSLTHPHTYVESNLVGFLNILEGCRHHGVRHLVYASSSSVYGANKKVPFSTTDDVDHPISLYAASKKANELMAFCYSHLYDLPTTGLRFFTVYGPWGRPDMALFIFTRAILNDEPIDVYNYGKMQRDFTYIDDIVEGVVRVLDRIPPPLPEQPDADVENVNSRAPYKVYNIGNHSPVELLRFIETLEKELGRKAKLNLLPLQPGDVVATCADVDDLMRDTGFKPDTPIEAGIRKFVEWYRSYYRV